MSRTRDRREKFKKGKSLKTNPKIKVIRPNEETMKYMMEKKGGQALQEPAPYDPTNLSSIRWDQLGDPLNLHTGLNINKFIWNIINPDTPYSPITQHLGASTFLSVYAFRFVKSEFFKYIMKMPTNAVINPRVPGGRSVRHVLANPGIVEAPAEVSAAAQAAKAAAAKGSLGFLYENLIISQAAGKAKNIVELIKNLEEAQKNAIRAAESASYARRTILGRSGATAEKVLREALGAEEAAKGLTVRYVQAVDAAKNPLALTNRADLAAAIQDGKARLINRLARVNPTLELRQVAEGAVPRLAVQAAPAVTHTGGGCCGSRSMTVVDPMHAASAATGANLEEAAEAVEEEMPASLTRRGAAAEAGRAGTERAREAMGRLRIAPTRRASYFVADNAGAAVNQLQGIVDGRIKLDELIREYHEANNSISQAKERLDAATKSRKELIVEMEQTEALVKASQGRVIRYGPQDRLIKVTGLDIEVNERGQRVDYNEIHGNRLQDLQTSITNNDITIGAQNNLITGKEGAIASQEKSIRTQVETNQKLANNILKDNLPDVIKAKLDKIADTVHPDIVSRLIKESKTLSALNDIMYQKLMNKATAASVARAEANALKSIAEDAARTAEELKAAAAEAGTAEAAAEAAKAANAAKEAAKGARIGGAAARTANIAMKSEIALRNVLSFSVFKGNLVNSVQLPIQAWREVAAAQFVMEIGIRIGSITRTLVGLTSLSANLVRLLLASITGTVSVVTVFVGSIARALIATLGSIISVITFGRLGGAGYLALRATQFANKAMQALGPVAAVAGGVVSLISAFGEHEQAQELKKLKEDPHVKELFKSIPPTFAKIVYMPYVHCNIFDTDGKSTVTILESDTQLVKNIDIIPLTTNTLSVLYDTSKKQYISGYTYTDTNENSVICNYKSPRGIAIDRLNQYIYVADTANHTIVRFQQYEYSLLNNTGSSSSTYASNRIDGNQMGMTVGGSYGTPGYQDCTEQYLYNSLFNFPTGLEIDPTNTWLFITDSGNHVIRKMNIAGGNLGMTQLLVGIPGSAGTSDGTNAAQAQFNNPQGLCIENTGKFLYVADTGNSCIRVVNALTGHTDTVSVYQESLPAAHGDVTHKLTTFLTPTDVVFDNNTSLYIIDQAANSVFQMYLISTPAFIDQKMRTVGPNTMGPTAASSINITEERNTMYGNLTNVTGYIGISKQIISGIFYCPTNIAIDYNASYLYITDSLNNLIWQYTTSNGKLNVLGGQGGSFPCVSSETKNHSDSCDFDTSSVRRGTPATISKFNIPTGIVVSRDNTELFVVENGSAQYISDACNNTKADSGTAKSDSPQLFMFGTPGNSTPDAGIRSLKLYNTPIAIEYKYFAGGTTTLHTPETQIPGGNVNPMTGPAIEDRFGNYRYVISNYVYNGKNYSTILSYPLKITGGTPTVLAGHETGFGDSTWSLPEGVVDIPLNPQNGTPAVVAQRVPNNRAVYFNNPQKLALDPLGNYLYVADTGNNLIRRIFVGDGNILHCTVNDTQMYGHTETLAGTLPPGLQENKCSDSYVYSGNPPAYCTENGNSASFNGPSGITVDPSNNCIYVADTQNHCIKKISLVKTDNDTIDGATTVIAGVSGKDGYQDSYSYINNISSTNSADNIIMNADGTYSDHFGNTYPEPYEEYKAGWKTIFYDESKPHAGVTYPFVASGIYCYDQITKDYYVGVCTPDPSEGGTYSLSKSLFYFPYDLCLNKYGSILYVADTGNALVREVVVAQHSTTSFIVGTTTTLAGTYNAPDYSKMISAAVDDFIISSGGYQANFGIPAEIFDVKYNASTTSTKRNQRGGDSTRKLTIRDKRKTTIKNKNTKKIEGVEIKQGGASTTRPTSTKPTLRNLEQIVENVDITNNDINSADSTDISQMNSYFMLHGRGSANFPDDNGDMVYIGYQLYPNELPGIIMYSSYNSDDGRPDYDSITARGKIVANRRGADSIKILSAVPLLSEEWNVIMSRYQFTGVQSRLTRSGSLNPSKPVAANAPLGDFWNDPHYETAMLNGGCVDDPKNPNNIINKNNKLVGKAVLAIRRFLLKDFYNKDPGPMPGTNTTTANTVDTINYDVFPDDLARFALFFDNTLPSGYTLGLNAAARTIVNDGTYFTADDIANWQRGVLMGFLEGQYLKYNVYYSDFVSFTPRDMNPIFLSKSLKTELKQIEWVPILKSVRDGNLQVPMSLSSQLGSTSTSSKTYTSLVETARLAGAKLCNCSYPLDVARAANILDPYISQGMITDIIISQWNNISQNSLATYKLTKTLEEDLINESLYRVYSELNDITLQQYGVAMHEYYNIISLMVANGVPIPPELIINNEIYVMPSESVDYIGSMGYGYWNRASNSVLLGVPTYINLGLINDKSLNAMMYTLDASGNYISYMRVAKHDRGSNFVDIGQRIGDLNNYYTVALHWDTDHHVVFNPPLVDGLFSLPVGSDQDNGLPYDSFMPYDPTFINKDMNCSKIDANGGIISSYNGICTPKPIYKLASPPPVIYDPSKNIIEFETNLGSSLSQLDQDGKLTPLTTTYAYDSNNIMYPVGTNNGPSSWWCGKIDTDSFNSGILYPIDMPDAEDNYFITSIGFRPLYEGPCTPPNTVTSVRGASSGSSNSTSSIQRGGEQEGGGQPVDFATVTVFPPGTDPFGYTRAGTGGPNFIYDGINLLVEMYRDSNKYNVSPYPYADNTITLIQKPTGQAASAECWAVNSPELGAVYNNSYYMDGIPMVLNNRLYFGPCTLSNEDKQRYDKIIANGDDLVASNNWPWAYNPNHVTVPSTIPRDPASQKAFVGFACKGLDKNGVLKVLHPGPCAGPEGPGFGVYQGPPRTTTLAPTRTIGPTTTFDLSGFLSTYTIQATPTSEPTPTLFETRTIDMPTSTNTLDITSDEYARTVPESARSLYNAVLNVISAQSHAVSTGLAADTAEGLTSRGTMVRSYGVTYSDAITTHRNAQDIAENINDSLGTLIQKFQDDAMPIINAVYAEVTNLINTCKHNIDESIKNLEARTGLDAADTVLSPLSAVPGLQLVTVPLSVVTGFASLGMSLYTPKDKVCWMGDLSGSGFIQRLKDLYSIIDEDMKETIEQYQSALNNAGSSRYQYIIDRNQGVAALAHSRLVALATEAPTFSTTPTANTLNLTTAQLDLQNQIEKHRFVKGGGENTDNVLTYTARGTEYVTVSDAVSSLSDIIHNPAFASIYEADMVDIYYRTLLEMADHPPNMPLTNQMTCQQQRDISLEIAMTAYNNNIITDWNGLYSVSSLQQFILGYPIFIKTPNPQQPDTLFGGVTGPNIQNGIMRGSIFKYRNTPINPLVIFKPVSNTFNTQGVIYTSKFTLGSSHFQDNACNFGGREFPYAFESQAPFEVDHHRTLTRGSGAVNVYTGLGVDPFSFFTGGFLRQEYFHGDCVSYVNYLNSGVFSGLATRFVDDPDQNRWHTWEDTVGTIPLSVCVGSGPTIKGITQRDSKGNIGSEYDRLQSLKTTTTTRQRGGQITDENVSKAYETAKEKKDEFDTANVSLHYTVFAAKITNTVNMIKECVDGVNNYVEKLKHIKPPMDSLQTEAAANINASATSIAEIAATAVEIANTSASISKSKPVINENDEIQPFDLVGGKRGQKKKSKVKKGGAITTTKAATVGITATGATSPAANPAANPNPTTTLSPDNMVMLSENLERVSDLLFTASNYLDAVKDNYRIADPTGAAIEDLSGTMSIVNQALTLVTVADNYSTTTISNNASKKVDSDLSMYLSAAKKALSYAQFTAKLGNDPNKTMRMAENAKEFASYSIRNVASSSSTSTVPNPMLKMFTKPSEVNIPNTYLEDDKLRMPIDNYSPDPLKAIMLSYDEYSLIYTEITKLASLVAISKGNVKTRLFSLANKQTGTKVSKLQLIKQVNTFEAKDIYNDIISLYPNLANDDIVNLENVSMLLMAQLAGSRLGEFMNPYMKPKLFNPTLLSYATAATAAPTATAPTAPTATTQRSITPKPRSMQGGGPKRRRNIQKGGATTTSPNLSLGKRVFIELARAAGSAKTLSKDPYEVAFAASEINPILKTDPVLNILHVITAQYNVLRNENNTDAIDTDNFIPDGVKTILKKPLENTDYLAMIIEKKRRAAQIVCKSTDPITVAKTAMFDDPNHPTINAAAVAFAQGIINVACKYVPYYMASKDPKDNGFTNTVENGFTGSTSTVASNTSNGKHASLFIEAMKISKNLQTTDPMKVANSAESTTTLGSAYDVEDYEWAQRYVNSIEDKMIYFKIDYARSEAQKVVEETKPNNKDPNLIAKVAMALDASIALDPIVNKLNIADAQRAINAHNTLLGGKDALFTNVLSPEEKFTEISNYIFAALLITSSNNKNDILNFITTVINPTLLNPNLSSKPQITLDDVNHVIDLVFDKSNKITSTLGQSGGQNPTLPAPPTNFREVPGGLDTDTENFRSIVLLPGNDFTIQCNLEGVCSAVSLVTGVSSPFTYSSLGTIFNGIMSITIDNKSNFLYVADSGNHVIQQIDTRTGETVTLAGNTSICYADHFNPPDGPPNHDLNLPCNGVNGLHSSFNIPTSVAISHDNLSLIVYDETGYIRKVNTGLLQSSTLLKPDGTSLIASCPVPYNHGVTVDAPFPPGIPQELSPATITATYDPIDRTTLILKVSDNGKWSGCRIESYNYRWARDIDIISREDTYRTTAEDTGGSVLLYVQAKSTSGSVWSSPLRYSNITGIPINNRVPTIAGNLIINEILEVSPGSWKGYPQPTYTYQWSLDDGVTTGVSTSTGNTYTPKAVGTLTVTVTATNIINEITTSVTATSISYPITSIAPSNTEPGDSPPILVSNRQASGNYILTVNKGTWSGTAPLTYSYQWFYCDETGENTSALSSVTTSPSSAINDTYSTQEADIGKYIKVGVTVKNGAGVSSATVYTSPYLVNGLVCRENPQITFEYNGSSLTLSASEGLWNSSPPASFTYSWKSFDNTLQNGVIFPALYTPKTVDIGKTVDFILRATNSSDYSVSVTVTSRQITGFPPTNTSQPTVSGQKHVNGQLSITAAGVWSGYPAPTGYTYEWIMNTGNTNNPVSSGTSFTPRVAGVLTLTETAHVTINNVDYPVAGLPVTIQITEAPSHKSPTLSNPSITSSTTIPQAGANCILTGNVGSWDGSAPMTYVITWLYQTTSSGSTGFYTGDTFMPTANDVGKSMYISVVATNDAGNSDPVVSDPIIINGIPTITGVLPKVTLTYDSSNNLSLVADPGKWTGYPAPTYTYQWGSSVTFISSNTYIPTAADSGKTISVVVKATNIVGETTSSATSAAVTWVPFIDPTDANYAQNVLTVSGITHPNNMLTASSLWAGYPNPNAYVTYNWTYSDGSTSTLPTSGTTYQLTKIGTLVVTATAKNNINGIWNSVTTAPVYITIDSAPTMDTTTVSNLPSIVGNPQVGMRLTVSNGNWQGSPPITFTYVWNNVASSSTSSIVTGSSEYTPVEADMGNFITVTVTAKNNVSATGTSATSPAVQIKGLPFVKTTPKIVFNYSGSSLSLSTDNGLLLWGGFPEALFTYRWTGFSSSSNTSTYTPQLSDVGNTVTLSITATNLVGPVNLTITSDTITGPPILDTRSVPGISGTPQVGEVLTVSQGTWSGFPRPEYTYTWSDGTTGQTCTPRAEGQLSVIVTAKNTINGNAYSAPYTAYTTVINPPPVYTLPVLDPSNKPTITIISGTTSTVISGVSTATATLGNMLTVSTGSWSGNPAPTYTYLWNNDPLMTAANYTPTINDLDAPVTVKVTATNSQGTSSFITSITINPPIPAAVSGFPFSNNSRYAGITCVNSKLYVLCGYNSNNNNVLMTKQLPSGSIVSTEFANDGITDYLPVSICVDSSANIYITMVKTELDGSIYKINTGSTTYPPFSLYAGCQSYAGYHDGSINGNTCDSNTCPTSSTNSLLCLGEYGSLVLDSTGANIYFTDSGNHCIRKIDTNAKTVSTVSPSMNSANSGQNNPMVGCDSNNLAIGFPSSGDLLTWFDNNNMPFGLAQIDGSTSNPYVSFFNPAGITIDSTNTYLFVGDVGSSTIRKVKISDGTVETIAGVYTQYGWADVNRSVTDPIITLTSPYALTCDSRNNIYFIDGTNNRVRVLIYNPSSTKWDKSFTLVSPVSSGYNYIMGICLDRQTNPTTLYFTDNSGVYSIPIVVG